MVFPDCHFVSVGYHYPFTFLVGLMWNIVSELSLAVGFETKNGSLPGFERTNDVYSYGFIVFGGGLAIVTS